MGKGDRGGEGRDGREQKGKGNGGEGKEGRERGGNINVAKSTDIPTCVCVFTCLTAHSEYSTALCVAAYTHVSTYIHTYIHTTGDKIDQHMYACTSSSSLAHLLNISASFIRCIISCTA